MSFLSRLTSWFNTPEGISGNTVTALDERSEAWPVFVYVDDLDGMVFYVGRRAAYDNTRVRLAGSGYITKGRFLA